MGSLFQYTFDGQPSGTVATIGNTGATTVNALNGGAVTFDSGMAARGTQCGLKFQGTQAASVADVRYTIPSNSVYEWSFVFTTPAAAGTDYILHQLFVGSTRGYSLTYTAGGNVSLYDAANTVSSIITGAALSTKYRITIAVDNSGGTSAGKFTAKGYSASGTLLGTASSSTANLASGAFSQLRIGQTTFPSAGGVFGVDDVQGFDGSTTEIPPMTSTSPTPPTEVINDRALYVIDRHASTGTGTSLSYAITQTAGATTAATLLAPGIWGVVQPATGTLTYQVTVTTVGGADDGQTATDTVNVPAAASSTPVRTMLQWVPGNPGSWQ